MKFVHTIFCLLALSLAVTSTVADEVQVYAQVDTSRDIYVGQSFTFNIIIDGISVPGTVDLGALDQYNVEYAGGRDVSQRSFSMINGKTTSSETKRYVMSYTLSIDKTGPMRIEPLSVIVEGRQYKTNPVSLNILEPGKTDNMWVELEASEKSCYVGQPVLMTIKWFSTRNVKDTSIVVPAFTSGAFDYDEVDISARNYRVDTVNLHDVPVTITEQRTKIGPRDVTVFTLSKVLIPKRPGKFELGPVDISTEMAVSVSRNSFLMNQYNYERFKISSVPLSLEVKPLPDDEKPADFYGLIGRYDISASALPTKVNVGDPITLNITIAGDYLKQVRWPGLEGIPALVNNFKIPSEKASPEIKGNTVIFTQTIRAENDSVCEIPPIPLSYFDVDSAKYITVSTKPIPLEVAETEILTATDLQGADGTAVSRRIEAIQKGISANYDMIDFENYRKFELPGTLISLGSIYTYIWGVPLVVLIGSIVIKISTYKNENAIAVRKRKKACVNAVAQINKAADDEKYELILTALRQFIADRFDKKAGSLTAVDCKDIIAEKANDDLAGQFADIFTKCQAARFAPLESKMDSQEFKGIDNLLREIDTEAGK